MNISQYKLKVTVSFLEHSITATTINVQFQHQSTINKFQIKTKLYKIRQQNFFEQVKQMSSQYKLQFELVMETYTLKQKYTRKHTHDITTITNLFTICTD